MFISDAAAIIAYISHMLIRLNVFLFTTCHKNSPIYFNPFVPNAFFLYPLKILENLTVFFMFSGGRERVHWEQMA